MISYYIATKNCNSLNCEQSCKASLDGGVCTCREGMTINSKDQKTCVDFDECHEWGYCDQFCTNTPGSYQCHCGDGYTLSAQRHCKAQNSMFQFML